MRTERVERLRFATSGKLVVASGEFDLQVTNLTTHGIAGSIASRLLTIKGRKSLAAGACVHAELTLDGHPVVLTGRVFWSNASYSDEARLLIEFDGLDGAALRLISTWMAERADRLRVKPAF